MSDAPVQLSNAEWQFVLGEAVRQGLGPLFAARLQGSPRATNAPAGLLDVLRALSLHSQRRHVSVFGELSELLSALRHADIDCIALKGAHLASCVYADPALRPMGDMDLLVRPRDLVRAERVLSELGYAPAPPMSNGVDYARHHHISPYRRAESVPIELHRTIVPLDSPFQLDPDALWQRARPARVAGVTVLVLSPEDLIVHLVLHAAYNHRFLVPLRAICDIDVVVRHYNDQLQWSRLAALANGATAGPIVYGTLTVVRQTLRTPIPHVALERFDHDERDVRATAILREFLVTAPAVLPAGYAELGEHQGARAKLRTLMRVLFPPTARLAAIYRLRSDSKWLPWFYLVRPLDLIMRRGRITIDLLCRTRQVRPSLKWHHMRLSISRWLDEASAQARSRQ